MPRPPCYCWSATDLGSVGVGKDCDTTAASGVIRAKKNHFLPLSSFPILSAPGKRSSPPPPPQGTWRLGGVCNVRAGCRTVHWDGSKCVGCFATRARKDFLARAHPPAPASYDITEWLCAHKVFHEYVAGRAGGWTGAGTGDSGQGTQTLFLFSQNNNPGPFDPQLMSQRLLHGISQLPSPYARSFFRDLGHATCVRDLWSSPPALSLSLFLCLCLSSSPRLILPPCHTRSHFTSVI